MLMRRTDEPVSHEEALQEALGLAVAWLQRSDEPIPSIDGASSKFMQQAAPLALCDSIACAPPYICPCIAVLLLLPAVRHSSAMHPSSSLLLAIVPSAADCGGKIV